MKRIILLSLIAIVTITAVLWLAKRERPFNWQLPAGYPVPIVPADNPMSAAKVELGRWLFYDVRLSLNQTMACSSCHLQQLAFTDGKSRAIGATGELHPRGSMTLVNSGYASRLTWANSLLDRLEDQALTPLLGDNPVEMGMGGREAEVGELLANEVHYRALTRSAFPGDENPYSILNAVRAISAFTRSIVSFDSPYDRYLAGDANAISANAQRGMDLFFSEKFECFHCHGGFNFTDSTTHASTAIASVGFHNNGLYNIDGNGAYPPDNPGLFDMTGKVRDMGRFKAPTLRNITLTAPYMHDGSIATLPEVLEHYARGGRLIESGPYRGDGRLSPYKSEFVVGFEMSAREKEDLLAFLAALTDESVINAERWSNPFAQ